MLSNAPVALRCTRISFDLANLVRGTNAPDLAICVLFSSEIGQSRVFRKEVESRPTMSGKIGDASYCITLNLHIRAQHLSDKWFQSTQ
jgi:hypothetical protein